MDTEQTLTSISFDMEVKENLYEHKPKLRRIDN